MGWVVVGIGVGAYSTAAFLLLNPDVADTEPDLAKEQEHVQALEDQMAATMAALKKMEAAALANHAEAQASSSGVQEQD